MKLIGVEGIREIIKELSERNKSFLDKIEEYEKLVEELYEDKNTLEEALYDIHELDNLEVDSKIIAHETLKHVGYYENQL